jgi:hypothetical protein
MNIEKIDDLIDQSLKIREKYHQLERIHHGSEWTVEEDALAYLTDAGLIGRNIINADGVVSTTLKKMLYMRHYRSCIPKYLLNVCQWLAVMLIKLRSYFIFQTMTK